MTPGEMLAKWAVLLYPEWHNEFLTDLAALAKDERARERRRLATSGAAYEAACEETAREIAQHGAGVTPRPGVA